MTSISGDDSLTPGAPPRAVPLAIHVRETVALALPIIVARLAMMVMYVVDTLMAGWAGTNEIAYMGLGLAPQLVFLLVAMGALQSVVVLTAQAQGAGDGQASGRIFRAGLVHAFLIGFAVMGLSAVSEAFFLATGQTAELSAGAARVTHQFAWGVPGLLAFVATSLYLEATGRPRAGMIILIAVNILNVPANGIVGLGWGGFVEPMGAVGTVLTSSVLRWTAFLAALAVLLLDERAKGHPHRLPAPLRTIAAEVVTLGGEVGAKLRAVGVPMGIAQGVESAAFATIVFIAGLIGTTAIAAHQITMTLVSLVYMSAVGMAGATAIRVGRAVGAGANREVGRAGLAGVVLGMAFALPFSILFLVAPDRVAGIYTSDPAVLTVTRQTFLVASFFMCFDAAMGVVMGALRGMGDVWIPTILQTSAFWIVAVPAAWVLATMLGYGPAGLMGGIFAGLLVSLALLIPRFHRVSTGPIRRM